MKTKSIKQTAIFNASPGEVYAMLMDAGKHSSLTGSTVKISKKANGKFEVFDGYCHGYNISWIRAKKIMGAAFSGRRLAGRPFFNLFFSI